MKKMDSQQLEFEVFPKDPKDSYSYLSDFKKDTNSGASSITVALPQQSIVILVLCVVMLLVVSFTLGVERGKLISGKTALAPSAPWERISAPAPMAVAPSQEVPAEARQETPQPAAVATKDAEPAGNQYVIQVASLKTEQAASRLADTLTKGGWPSFTKTSGDYVVVLAGSFREKKEAQNRIGELKKTYTDCFIKKI